MKIYLTVFLIVLGMNSFLLAQNQRSVALKEITTAENNFADRAAASDTRTAFLEFADDNALVFGQKPENAKESWQKRKPNQALLSWRPLWADVAASGDIGYTTGSWSFSRTKNDAPGGWGEYFTIWKKRADGSWKFALDIGIQHDKADVIVNAWKSPNVSGKSNSKNSPANTWSSLEKTFAESVEKNGVKKAYEKFSSDQIRVLRNGMMPLQGKSAALTQITGLQLTTKVLGGETVADFAYVYGEYELKLADQKTEKGFYLRVWKNEGKNWRITADLANPTS